MKVVIKKNDKVVKEFNCNTKTIMSVWNRAIDIAGGMWNGKDDFRVAVLTMREVSLLDVVKQDEL